MCGIVGYVGSREATPIVFQGLRQLEYRGYDSAGIAVIQQGQIEIRRDVGKLDNLAKLLDAEPMAGQIAIGHTRWATHGKPSQTMLTPTWTAQGRLSSFKTGSWRTTGPCARSSKQGTSLCFGNRH